MKFVSVGGFVISFQVDPSGSYFAWKASAIGKHAVSAKDFLEKRFDYHRFNYCSCSPFVQSNLIKFVFVLVQI